MGPAAARNRGINDANGEIILFLDDDSIPTEGWLKKNIELWEKSIEVDGIGGYIEKNKSEGIVNQVNTDLFNWYLDARQYNGICHFICSCNSGYRKKTLEEVGGFDESFNIAAGEDRELNDRMVKKRKKLILVKDIKVYHDRGLSFNELITKHFNYGKASRKIMEAHGKSGFVAIKEYIRLFYYIINQYKSIKNKMLAVSILTISQTSIIAGYLYMLIIKK